jgi:hypothetical protein
MLLCILILLFSNLEQISGLGVEKGKRNLKLLVVLSLGPKQTGQAHIYALENGATSSPARP